MKAIFLVAALFSLAASAETKIEIPATEILALARTVVPQTGPFYEVSGVLACTVVTHEEQSASVCYMDVNGFEFELSNPAPIIEVVKEVIPSTGSFYQFGGTYKATSLSREVPPYRSTEKAVLTVQ